MWKAFFICINVYHNIFLHAFCYMSLSILLISLLHKQTASMRPNVLWHNTSVLSALLMPASLTWLLVSPILDVFPQPRIGEQGCGTLERKSVGATRIRPHDCDLNKLCHQQSFLLCLCTFIAMNHGSLKFVVCVFVCEFAMVWACM